MNMDHATRFEVSALIVSKIMLCGFEMVWTINVVLEVHAMNVCM